MPLSSQQRRTFEEDGLVWLEGQYSDDFINQLRTDVWDRLDEFGVVYDDIASWAALDANKLRRILKECRRKIPGISNLYSEGLRQTANQLLGTRTKRREMRAGVLITPPRSFGYGNESTIEWHIPSTFWHTDLARSEQRGLLGLRVFLYLDDVQPCGGGTLVIKGSHKLCEWGKQFSSKQVKRYLKKYDYFKKLWKNEDGDSSNLLNSQAVVEDVNIELKEMTGKKGDLLIWDPRLLHTIAPNALNRPRLVAEGMFMSEAIFDGTQDQSNST